MLHRVELHVTATTLSSLETRSAVYTKLIRRTVSAPSECGVTCRPKVEDELCCRGGVTDQWISIVVGTNTSEDLATCTANSGWG